VIVLSTDIVNATAGLVTVIPITSRKRAIRSRVEMKPPDGGLSVVSYVICEQSRTISVTRLTTLLGMASPATMRAASEIVRVLLGL
jgi:mRNA interferase MazF